MLLNLSLRRTDKHLAAVKTVAKFAARSVYLTDVEFPAQFGAHIPAEYATERVLEWLKHRQRRQQTMKRWLPR